MELPNVAKFSRENQDVAGTAMARCLSRLIKYATIISVSTVARSPFPSLRDAAKRSLFGLIDEESAARERRIFREEIGAPW